MAANPKQKYATLKKAAQAKAGSRSCENCAADTYPPQSSKSSRQSTPTTLNPEDSKKNKDELIEELLGILLETDKKGVLKYIESLKP
jgi:hypothetical protein